MIQKTKQSKTKILNHEHKLKGHANYYDKKKKTPSALIGKCRKEILNQFRIGSEEKKNQIYIYIYIHIYIYIYEENKT